MMKFRSKGEGRPQIKVRPRGQDREEHPAGPKVKVTRRQGRPAYAVRRRGV